MSHDYLIRFIAMVSSLSVTSLSCWFCILFVLKAIQSKVTR
jgi:hypothetical protein